MHIKIVNNLYFHLKSQNIRDKLGKLIYPFGEKRGKTMEEQKNTQELQEETVQTPVTAEEIPAAETAAEEDTVETEAAVSAEPAKKATPGKIAVAVGIVILLAALLIALVLGGKDQKTETTENAPAEETAVVETVEATIPADGNPDDVTCKGSYSVSDEEAIAAGDTVVATIGDHQLTSGHPAGGRGPDLAAVFPGYRTEQLAAGPGHVSHG